MNIVILNESPHKKGTNAYLLDEFIRGAEDAGRQVYRFDAAFKKTCERLFPYFVLEKVDVHEAENHEGNIG